MPTYAAHTLIHSDNGPKDGKMITKLFKNDKFIRTLKEVEGGVEVIKDGKVVAFFKTKNPVGLITQLMMDENSYQ